eukprot:gene27574-50096_t
MRCRAREHAAAAANVTSAPQVTSIRWCMPRQTRMRERPAAGGAPPATAWHPNTGGEQTWSACDGGARHGDGEARPDTVRRAGRRRGWGPGTRSLMSPTRWPSLLMSPTRWPSLLVSPTR